MNTRPSFDALLTEKTDRSERTASTTAARVEIEQRDFANMTRQELQDWVREQTLNGEMSVDDASAFLSVGGLVYIGPGVAEARMQTERVNFFDIAQGSRDFYLQRGDQAAADRIQGALDLMERSQGQITRFDARI